MNLNRNSLHARLYRFFYATDEMPRNLCPYFWKLLLAFAVIVPYVVIALPIFICDHLIKERTASGARLGLGLLVWLALGFTLALACGNYHIIRFLCNLKFNKELSSFAAFYDGIIIIIFLIWTIRTLLKKAHSKEPPEYIVIEFIKASYNKYCPSIKWNTKTQNQ